MIPTRFLAFDFGTKKIGVATGQSVTGTATPLPAIQALQEKTNWESIKNYIDEWQPEAFVIGLPLDKDGSRQEITELAEQFADQLKSRFQIDYFWMDERYSSQAADAWLKSRKPKQRHKKNNALNKDSIAAVLILESWFNLNSHQSL